MKKIAILPFLLLLLLAACEKESVSPADLETEQTLDFRASQDCTDCVAAGKVSVAFVNGAGKLKYICVDQSAVQDQKDEGRAVDEDGDCFYHIAGPWGPIDCNDDPNDGGGAINPDATEILCNGIDDDCNSNTPDSSAEICDNGIDDDCDGLTDEDDDDCTPISSNIFAIAYTNVDGVDGFDESAGDVLIAKWVDGPEGSPDGVIGAGDYVVTDQFPTDVFAASFGNFTVNKHVMTGVNFINPAVGLGGSNATNATFAFVNDGNREAYIERVLPATYQPTGTTIEDRQAPNFGVDTAHLGGSSPSSPNPSGITQFAGDGETDSPHIDVKIFIP